MAAYDIVVIGGGTAGLVTAAGSAGIGARVALVEQERLGGECLWTGCVPSKALIAVARAAHGARHATRFGVRTGGVETDFAAAMAWVVQAQRGIEPHDSAERFRSLGVDVISGQACFTGDRTLSVGDRVLSPKRIVIATGSKPAIPPIAGLADVAYLTNETIFSIQRLPASLLVLGGGPVGLELAQAFARLGSEVNVVEAATQLLPHEDHELADALAERLRADGVRFHLGVEVTNVVARNGRIRLSAAAGEPFALDGEALLVATGRTPNLASLQPEQGGVAVTKGGVAVDRSLRTSAPHVWAAGDCVGPLRFTHVADYQARLVVRNAFFPFHAKTDYSVVPWVTFTDPELAHVGLTEREARDRFGDRVRTWRRPFATVDRAVMDGETHGLVKLVTDRRGRILGGHILGHGAGDMIGEIVLAIKHGISASALSGTIHAYPTYPEAIKQAAEGYSRSRFTPLVKSVARWFARR